MSELSTINDLLEDEIKDLYSAEKQLTKAIPKMAKGSNNEELASAFEAHLKETRLLGSELDPLLTTLRVPFVAYAEITKAGALKVGTEVRRIPATFSKAWSRGSEFCP
jgi:ferritin-like metal-binding protein YciE